MKKISITLFALLISAALSVPAWGHGTVKSKQQCPIKKVKHHVKHHPKFDKHKRKALMQFKILKKAYNVSMEDARQMFLEYLGTGLPCADTDVEAIRQEYEQQIAQLNETIASQEQQITGLNTTVASQEQQITGLNTTVASQEQQITGLNATVASQEQQIAALNTTVASQEQQILGLNTTVASQLQQLADLNATLTTQQQQLAEADATIASLQQQLEAQAAAHQEEMDNLAAAMTDQCNGQIDTAYNNGMAAGLAECPDTDPAGEPQQVSFISTGSYYPYALDVDANGNTFVVERNYRSVVGYDSTGSQIAAWTPATLVYPVDLAVDSHGDIFILDQGSLNYLQKFSPNGEQLEFTPSVARASYPMGIFIDSQDNIYIIDNGGLNGSRILKFDSTGALVATIGDVAEPALSGDEYSDIAVDEDNQTIYIVTRYNHMVAKFGMDGTYLGAWEGDLRNPNSIAIGSLGQVFVADTYNDQIDQYDADGNLVYTISSDQMYRPSRIVVDDTGKLFIAVESYQSVQVYQ